MSRECAVFARSSLEDRSGLQTRRNNTTNRRHNGGIIAPEITSMYNALTIDVEDYYMVSGFSDIIAFEAWPRYESRVVRNTGILLDVLAAHNVKGTFFVLGWIGERCPGLVRDIHAAGHEIACHGYNHRLIYELSPEQFREDVRKAKGILENITGTKLMGYRAASYSIVRTTLWALDVLIDEGFYYDSSIFPIHHDRYGIPESDRFPHTLRRERGTMWEFPPSTYRIFNQNLPIAGGGYLRLLPLTITRTAIKKINEQEKKPVIVYLHPWEIDIDQPKINGRWLSRARHYVNLKSTLPKLQAFLSEFKFGQLSRFLQ
jgi:polysaccharide deacetylase family protein (PEP-CTERM system associated)